MSRRARICSGREHLDSRRRQFEREREVVETAADLGDGVVGWKVGLDCPCTCQKEADALLVHEGWHWVLLLAGDMKRLPARDEQVEPRTSGEQSCDIRGCVHDLLEVVEDEEQ